MSNDLVARLRDQLRYATRDPICEEAAAALEAKDARIAELERRIAEVRSIWRAMWDAAGVEANRGADMSDAKPTVRQVNPLTAPRARAFRLVRDDDETGISGTGTVAEGIEFSNGMCAMCWLTAMHSVAVYPNMRQLEAIHGHNGRTRVVYVATDEPT